MMSMSGVFLVCATVALPAERPYQFRERIECVHARDVRDVSRAQTPREFAFTDGVRLVMPADADDVLRNAVRDFEDYLDVSMGVAGKVEKSRAGAVADGRGGVVIALDATMAARTYTTETDATGVRIVAHDARLAAQALYHLEDVMNLRRAPFVPFGRERREHWLSPRMTHSGWGLDRFPEAYLRRVAHAGMDAILVFIRDVDRTKGSPAYQDVNALIRRAKAFGLDTYLYSYVHAFAHPEDSGARAVFEQSYGRVSAAYPEAKGFVFVGESCEFPTKDERAIPVEAAKRGKEWEGDTRPMAGYCPCRDYPLWVKAVSSAIRAHNPASDIVFWTYNWGQAAEGPRMALIDALPKDVSLMATWEMFEDYRLPNGFPCHCCDYTLAFAGPGKYFASEAARAKANGLTLYAMSNTGGLTWDFGDVPYLPTPYQWKRRWDGMNRAHDDWGLSGAMEDHHYGWHPSFVSELAKEAFVRGGMPFETHIRALAERDFDAANVEAVLAVWRDWSEALRLLPPTHQNQYSVFRMGPAYPFNVLGETIRDSFHPPKDPALPFAPYAANGAGIIRLNYADDQVRQWVEGLDYFPRWRVTDEACRQEVEAIGRAQTLFTTGAGTLRAIAETLTGARRAAALRMAGLGAFLGCTCRTACHLKEATRLEDRYLEAGTSEAEKAQLRQRILAIAREEYANAQAALPLVDFDSELGWEPSMEYVGSRPQIEWKLRLMEKNYGPLGGRR